VEFQAGGYSIRLCLVRRDAGLFTRRRFLRTGTTSLLATLCAPATVACGQSAGRPDVRAGELPALVQGSDGRTHLAYELHVTARRNDLLLERVRVFSGSEPLVTYEADELEGRIMRPEQPRSERYGRLVRRDTTAVLSVWVTVPQDTAPPRSLRHELFAGAANTPVKEIDVEVRDEEPILLGPPFKQSVWLALNGPGDHLSAHWGSKLAHAGRITVPQRYAIDFLGIEPTGRGVRGALMGSSNSDWTGFDAEVVAVADGIVVEARDGRADNPPVFEPPPPIGMELPAVGGNYIVLDIGRSRFVHYVHLRQSSVAVQQGQRVTRGQLLGHVGNSGNTNGAHLHFNVVDNSRQVEAEGVPYVFDAFLVRGTTTIDAAFGDDPPIAPAGTQDIRRALPLNGVMIEFAHTG